MPISGLDAIPTANDALGPAYTGRTVSDAAAVVNYVSQLATAKHVPYEVQCEILRLIQVGNAGAAFEVFKSTLNAIPAGPVTITGVHTINAVTGNPIYNILPADARQDEAAIAIITSPLAALTGGTATIAGSFTSTLDTRAAMQGQAVYVAPGGRLTLLNPSYLDQVNFVQVIGYVQTLSLNGVISGIVKPAMWQTDAASAA
jgi:hypothetical protein